ASALSPRVLRRIEPEAPAELARAFGGRSAADFDHEVDRGAVARAVRHASPRAAIVHALEPVPDDRDCCAVALTASGAHRLLALEEPEPGEHLTNRHAVRDVE